MTDHSMMSTTPPEVQPAWLTAAREAAPAPNHQNYDGLLSMLGVDPLSNTVHHTHTAEGTALMIDGYAFRASNEGWWSVLLGACSECGDEVWSYNFESLAYLGDQLNHRENTMAGHRCSMQRMTGRLLRQMETVIRELRRWPQP